MPRITGISPAKRRPGWYEIQLDGASHIVLPDQDFARLGLREGLELDQRELDQVVRAAEIAEARRIALRYLSVRPRSRREVELRLRKARTSPEAMGPTLDRLTELGYLDDRGFAAAFARDRIRLKPCGIRRLRSDLRSRGVTPEDADAGIREALVEEDTTEAELLDRAAAKRARRLDGADPRKARSRVFGFLMRRGFNAADARAWIDARWSETGSDPDTDLHA